MAHRVVLLALLGGTGLLAPLPLSAHGIQSTLDYLPSSGTSSRVGRMELQSSFSTGDPARDAVVRLLPADGGAAIELGHTGADGRLSFDLPSAARNGWEIQVDAGPGHRDYLEPTDAVNVPAAGQAHAPVQPQFWPGKLTGTLTAFVLIGGIGLATRLRRRF